MSCSLSPMRIHKTMINLSLSLSFVVSYLCSQPSSQGAASAFNGIKGEVGSVEGLMALRNLIEASPTEESCLSSPLNGSTSSENQRSSNHQGCTHHHPRPQRTHSDPGGDNRVEICIKDKKKGGDSPNFLPFDRCYSNTHQIGNMWILRTCNNCKCVPLYYFPLVRVFLLFFD